MTQNKFDQVFEDYGVHAVPAKKHVSWLHIGLIVWGINICLPSFFLGGMLAKEASSLQAIIAIFSGTLLLSLLAAGMGLVGTQTRLSLALSTQFSFGSKGQGLLAIILSLTSLGWFGIQLEIFGMGFAQVMLALYPDNIILPQWALVIVGGVLMTSTAVFGLKAIDKLSMVAIPLLMLVMVLPFFFLSQDFSLAKIMSHTTSTASSTGYFVAAVIGAMSVGTILLPDITRYSKSSSHTIGGIGLGMMLGFPLPLLLAFSLIVQTGQKDLLSAWLSVPSLIWNWIVLFTVVLATWTTNDNNLYSASLALNSFFKKNKKWQLSIICGMIGTALALIGVLKHFSVWLQLLAVTIPPMGAVLITDWFFKIRRSHLSQSDQSLKPPQFRPSAWLAWLFGVLVGVLAFFKIIDLTSIPPLDGMICTLVGYLVIKLLHTLLTQ